MPYEVEALVDQKGRILSEHVAGLDLHLDLGRLVPAERLRVREALREAMAALDATAGEKGAAAG